MAISISIDRVKKRFDEEYDFLYDHRDNVAGYDEAVESFDAFLKNEANACFVREFAAYRGDVVSSDREAAAFMFALDVMTSNRHPRQDRRRRNSEGT